jgi:putative transposase
MARRELRDDQWKRIKELLPGEASAPGRTATDNRKFVEAVLWIARTGAHWRELPDSFGAWNTVFQRYNRWSNASIWERVFRALSGDPDFEYVMIDSTIVRAPSTVRAQKGGSGDGRPWPFERRSDDKNPHCGRRPRQSPALYPDAGTGVGLHTGRAVAAGLARSACHCRQGIRQPQDR